MKVNNIQSNRIISIDLLRGVVMVIMALDHVRDYFHLNAFVTDPESIETTTPYIFFTRFITHFCAPSFIFLAGTSAYLYGSNKSTFDLSKFLITRGIWLIFVEIFVNNLLWWFDVTYGFINLQVIWAIGLCMILLGLLIYIPRKILLFISIIIIFGHNLLDGFTYNGQSFLEILWYITHQMNGFSISDTRMIWFTYPILPWLGVILLGYCLGYYYTNKYSAKKRKKLLLIIGISSIFLFFLIRGINIYGNLTKWDYQETFAKTVISFFKLTKYPPSLVFLLITLGTAFVFLSLVENTKNKITNFFLVFGKVPFFYYVLHIFVIHFFAIIGLLITGKDWQLMILTNETFSSGKLAGYGYSLVVVYVIWIAIILLLYPICKKYMIYKRDNKDKWWLKYL